MLNRATWTSVLLGLLWVSPANAQSTCDTLDPIMKTRLSVAWVSPLSATATQRSWIPVVQTAHLRAALEQTDADLARMLQMLGMRRRSVRTLDVL